MDVALDSSAPRVREADPHTARRGLYVRKNEDL